MKFIDDDSKKLNLLTKNYFYVATVLTILINILLFGLGGATWEREPNLYKNDNFSRFMNALYGCFSHASWQHVLLNMLCFLVCGLYLERKSGSLKFIVLIFFLCFFSRMAIVMTHGSNSSHGFSSVNYAIYGYIIIDYIFSVWKRDNIFNIISGFVIILLIVITMFFDGLFTKAFSFAVYPYTLSGDAHWSSFVAGLMTCALLKIESLIQKSSSRESS